MPENKLVEIKEVVVPYVERYLQSAIAAGRRRVSGPFPNATHEFLDWIFGDRAVEDFTYMSFQREKPGRVSLGVIAAFVGSTIGLPITSPQAKKWWDKAWTKHRGPLVARDMTKVERHLSTGWLAYWRTLISINPAVESSLARIRPIWRGRGPMGVELSIGVGGPGDLHDRPVFTTDTVRGLVGFDGSEDAAVSPYLDSTLFRPGLTNGHHLLLIYSTHILDHDEDELARAMIPVLYEPRFASSGACLSDSWLDAASSEKLRLQFQAYVAEDRDHLFDSESDQPEKNGKQPDKKNGGDAEDDSAEGLVSKALGILKREKGDEDGVLRKSLSRALKILKRENKGGDGGDENAEEYLARIGRALGTCRGDSELKRVITATKGKQSLDAICMSMVCRFPLVGLLAWNEKHFNQGDAPEVFLGKGDSLLGKFKEKAMTKFGRDGQVHMISGNCIAVKIIPPGVTAFIFLIETAFQRPLGIGDQGEEETGSTDYNFARWLIVRLGQLCSSATTESGRFIDLDEADNLDSVLLRTIEFLREQGKSHREIGEWLGRSQPATSRLLQRLDAARQKDLEDSSKEKDVHANTVVRGLSIAKSPSGGKAK